MGQRFAIVGGGIVGAAVARQVLDRVPDAAVTVFEKESAVAQHQTGHNSGVIHAGLYYEPGSLKATLCRRGVELMKRYVGEHGLPYDECGKVVVALDDTEVSRLHGIHDRAVANGVPGVRLVDAAELRDIEPGAVGREALYSPTTAITDYAAVARHLAAGVSDDGGQIRLNTEVRQLDRQSDGVIAHLGDGSTERFDYAIACVGVQSDRLARRGGSQEEPSIVPFFGQYCLLESRYRDVTKGLVYPVPDPRYPFLGVHLTKRVDGEMTVGPNAFLSLSREKYRGLGFNAKDTWELATDGGFWRFASVNIPAAIREAQGVASMRRFIAGAARYVPAVAGAKGIRLTRGIRAQALDRNGAMVDDFVIDHVDRVAYLRNAPSPGATSSMALAEHMVATMVDRHQLQ